MNKEHFFIYAVCGDKKHIQRLNLSISYLKRFSKNNIIVVTDLCRNNAPILHNNVIDIKTPAHLDDHQASIYLKTSLHKIADMEHDYCYLDTDVIAVREGVDDIFNHQTGVITFGSDRITISEFSPYAMNCGCLEKYKSSIETIQVLLDQHYEYTLTDPILIRRKQTLDKVIEKFKEYQATHTTLIEKRKKLDTLINEFEQNKVKDPVLIERSKKLDHIIKTFENNKLQNPELIKRWEQLQQRMEDFENNKLQKPELIERWEQLQQRIEDFENNKLQKPELIERWEQLQQRIEDFESNKLKDTELIEKKNKLDQLIDEFNDHKDKFYWKYLPWAYVPEKIRNILIKQPYFNFNEFFKKNGNFYWDEKKRQWSDNKGNIIYSDILHNFDNFFSINGGFHWNEFENRWYDHERNILYDDNIHNFHTFFETNGGFHWDENEKRWYDHEGNILYDDNLHDFHTFFETNGGFHWSENEKRWYDHEGNILYDDNLHDFHTFFEINGGFHWNEIENRWHDDEGNILDDDLNNFDKFFKKNGGFRWNENEKRWYDREGNILFDEKSYYRAIEQIENQTNYRLDRRNQCWRDLSGKNVYDNQCTHLLQAVNQKFNIKIENKEWVHWNGGVFLFNKKSIKFMDKWHQFTMEIFEVPEWSTRDQGTLAAAAWMFGFQNQNRLPQEYNLIVDYYRSSTMYHGDLVFYENGDNKIISPFFVHILHKFNDKDWKIWQDIENLFK